MGIIESKSASFEKKTTYHVTNISKSNHILEILFIEFRRDLEKNFKRKNRTNSILAVYFYIIFLDSNKNL
jgi:hypothetical protein